MTTRTAFALDLAAEAAHNPLARLRLWVAVDAARDELVAAGAPEAAEQVVSACVRLANPRHGHCKGFGS